ncbi:hypothetical protein GUJ93_ZPchr0005g15101 [Zizania palustris]|uniref:O-methyltransferase C-terminal domain-containing protein n=1 Tax=Zizania palustris TaxID=103762 RepID=A0A8J5S3D0_ZIZPA|nr:hypothetical protein GUJ93_ZPchr0005g15101 [Zizania palustris]
MFESVPPTNAIFLKWVLHDWSDEEYIKILKNCRKAILSKDIGGKRDEQEWKKIFLDAGFSGYKIVSILGFRSIIEVYP